MFQSVPKPQALGLFSSSHPSSPPSSSREAALIELIDLTITRTRIPSFKQQIEERKARIEREIGVIVGLFFCFLNSFLRVSKSPFFAVLRALRAVNLVQKSPPPHHINQD
jgi:hypothetical protein